MSINISSTTDSEEAVLSAMGKLAQKTEDVKEEKKPANESKDSNEKEASGPSNENQDDEALEENSDDESTDDTDENEDSEEEKQKPKKKGGFKKRIERFQRQLSEKDKEIEFLRAQAYKNNQQPEKPEKTEKLDLHDASAKPKPDSFETHEEYIEALTDWKLEQREVKAKEKQSEEKLKNEQQKVVQSFQEKVTEFSKDVTDFDDVLEEVDDVMISPVLQECIFTSEIGPQVIYELAKNRKELERINKLGYVAAAKEIGKLELKLSKAESVEAPVKEIKTTKAPPPPKTIGGSSKSGVQKNPDEMSYQEYKRWRDNNN